MGDEDDAGSPAPGPLADVRVLDLSDERAGAVGTMLLADLGADVVRPFVPGGPHERADRVEHAAAVCWDRGKRYVRVDGLDPRSCAEMAELLAACDVVIIDERPSALGEHGLVADDLAARAPHAVVGWFPTNGTRGPDAELPSDPLVLSALSGYAQLQCSATDTPIAPVVPATSNIHGALAAASVIATLIERERSGRGQSVTITGLHAAALMVATLSGEALDTPEVRRPRRDHRTSPTFRIYCCDNDEWLFLGALTPALFLTALDAMDLLELMVLPGVDGEFLNMFVGDNGLMISEGLERRFASRSRAHWLSVLGAAGVPVAPISTRDEWLASEPYADTGGSVMRTHPVLGAVSLPSTPLHLSVSAVSVGAVDDQAQAGSVQGIWSPRSLPALTVPGPPTPSDAPLAGVRVIDMSGFMAGPIGPMLMRQWGAEVIKVEPPAGDAYRLFTLSYASVNQGKRSVVLDLSDPAQQRTLRELANGADVFIDNLRPRLRERFGLDTETLSARNPGLVHTTIAAFAGDGPWSTVPGFDPVLQAWSGLMHASGIDGQPYYTSTGYHDVATGALSTLGTLAALFARRRLGRGQRVMVSLANSTKLVQLDEFTRYDGRPQRARGGIDFVGSGPLHRYYQALDGWLAVCASSDLLPVMLGWIGAADHVAHGDQVRIEAAIADVVRGRRRDDVLAELTARGIACVRVVDGDERGHDPHLVAESVLHIVDDPGIGRCRVMDGIARWSRSMRVETDTVPALGSSEPVWGR
ncbi:MAG: CoA transferase [Acidimicrobiia bacterium]